MNGTLTSIQKQICQQLSSIYTLAECRIIAAELLENQGFSRTQQLAFGDTKVSNIVAEQIAMQVLRLLNHEPLQYVIGYEWFMGYKFNVAPGVLIPRPETEELVQRIVDTAGNLQQHSVLDVGTGSGCIAISLNKLLDSSSVYAIDFSADAIAIAKQNAEQNNAQVEFVCQSIFDDNLPFKPQQFSVIVSNPPYVTENERYSMEPNVLNWEPHSALFVPNDNPLLFYKRIAECASIWLKNNGWLFFEINRMFGSETVQMLGNLGYKKVEVIKDISGNDRIVMAKWNVE